MQESLLFDRLLPATDAKAGVIACFLMPHSRRIVKVSRLILNARLVDGSGLAFQVQTPYAGM
jgi:hypothetical protein